MRKTPLDQPTIIGGRLLTRQDGNGTLHSGSPGEMNIGGQKGAIQRFRQGYVGCVIGFAECNPRLLV